MEHAQPINVGTSREKFKAAAKLSTEEKKGLELMCKDGGLQGDYFNTKHRDTSAGLDDVDVVGSGDTELAYSKKITDDPNETEESSSFGNTFSGSDEESVLSSVDMEVDSRYSAENVEHAVSYGFGKLHKRKKVTDHWRAYINPLMWRCQWLEMCMNELRSQALSYKKELASYRREKQLHSKMIEFDGSVSRAVPISCRKHQKRAMKRKRRKRVEDNIDLSSYMSNHNVFSYYESKKPKADCHPVDNDAENKEENVDEVQEYERFLQGLGGNDNSLEEMILNLDSLQSRVLGLKTRLGEVMSKNFMNIPSDAVVKSCTRRSLSFSSKNNGDAPLAASDNELELPGSAVSSYGDAVDIVTNDAQIHINDVKTETIDDYTLGSQMELKASKEEALSCSEDSKVSPKELESALLSKRPYTGKRRGRKRSRTRRGNLINDGGQNLYHNKRFSFEDY